MDPFERRRLGRSEVKLPQMGFGGAPLGDLFNRVPESDAQATIAAAWSSGIRYFDTAPWYGLGQSEHRLGRALYEQPRDQFVLSTKVGRVLRPPARREHPKSYGWAGGLPFEVRFDYSYDGIMRSYEDSQQRLGLNRIDILIIHDLDFGYHAPEARVAAYLAQLATSGCRALATLKDAGLVGAIGAGINELGMIPRFIEFVDLDFFLIALRYTLGEQEVLDHEIPLCVNRGIGLIVGAVFSSGIYATGPVPGAKYNYHDPTQQELDKIRRIEAICLRNNVPLAAVALQFPLHHPLVASVIPGGFRPEHVEANIATMRHHIPAALWAELKHERLIHPDAPTA